MTLGWEMILLPLDDPTTKLLNSKFGISRMIFLILSFSMSFLTITQGLDNDLFLASMAPKEWSILSSFLHLSQESSPSPGGSN